MTVTVDDQRRVALPSPARPGDVFDLEETGHARFLLTRVDRTAHTVRLERKDGYLMAVTDHVITDAATRAEMDEFP